MAEHSNMSEEEFQHAEDLARKKNFSRYPRTHQFVLNTDTYASTREPAQRYGRFCRISLLFIFHVANRSREERSESPVVCVYSRVNRSFST